MAVETRPLPTAFSTSAFRKMVMSFWAVGLCDGVGWVPVGEGVEPLVQGAGLAVVPGLVLWVVADALGVPCGDADGAACVPSVVSSEEC